MVKIKNTDDIKCWWGWEAAGMLPHRWWDAKRCGRFGSCPAVSYEAERIPSKRASSPAPWHLPRWIKTSCLPYVLHTAVYSGFIHNRPNLKQTRCPSVGERINELCYIQTMEYYSAIKRSELKGNEFLKKWMCTKKKWATQPHRISWSERLLSLHE